jgi:hypothetical protein
VVYVAWPAAVENARYHEGAPVVVEVAGGHTAGWIPEDATRSYVREGFVGVFFVFPGGETEDGRHSGGVFDYRGPHCARALADVIRFAQGKAPARRESGQEVTLRELVGYSVVTDEVGVVAQSNGGNVTIIALDEHGDELSGLAYYVGWETPVGDQVVTFELSNLNAINPAYTLESCSVSGCDVDYASVKLDSTRPESIKDWAYLPEVTGAPTLSAYGTLFFDADGDGHFDQDEYKSTVRAARLTDDGALIGFVSNEMRGALADLGINAEFLASTEDTLAFWTARDPGTGDHYQGVVNKLPALAVTVIGSVRDHGQAKLTDHALAWMQYQGWYEAGAGFLRFNPDDAYLVSSTYVETNPNEALDWDGINDHLTPDVSDPTVSMVAAEELADRRHAERSGDLSSSLWQ